MFFDKFLCRSNYDWEKLRKEKRTVLVFLASVLECHHIFHILKNENYQLYFLAGFFVAEIMTGKYYDRKKKEHVSLFGSVGKQLLVLFTYLVYNTVVRFFVVVSPYLSCLQNNPPENNVEPVPTKSEPVQLCGCVVFFLWFPPNMSCLQHNPLENNVEQFPPNLSCL